MGKGISTVIATILMLMIVIALAGSAYMFISGVFTGRVAQVLELIDFYNGEIVVRNSGTSSIPVASIKVFVSGSQEREAKIKSDKDPIPPGEKATLTILNAYEFNGMRKIRVIAPGGSFSFNGNFGRNFPEGNSTWYAKIGRHTGYGINECGWACNDWINVAPDNSWRWIPNLVAWYRFDEGSGNIANDETNRSDGTIYGATWVDGKYGKALSFDGVDDYVKTVPVPHIGIDNQPYTFAVWVKIAPGETDGNIIHMSSGADGFGWCLPPVALDGGRFRGHSWLPGGVSVYSTTIPEAGKWYHVAVTWDPTNGQRIFVNGILENSVTQSTYDGSGTNNYIWLAFTPGGCSGNKGWFNGIIDEVRIYNRALSEEEIKLLYEQGIGKFASPVSFDASTCPVKVYSGYFVCCRCEDPPRTCAGCEITGWFKKYITVPAGVSKVWMRFSTDDPIKIYVNGQLAYERGCCCNPCHPNIELTPYIKKGENLITVKFSETCVCGYFGGTIWYE